MVDNGRIIIEYEYDGSQKETIYFVLFKENFNEATNYYEIELVFPEMMVTYGQSLNWSSNLYDGTYYIGYFNKLDYKSYFWQEKEASSKIEGTIEGKHDIDYYYYENEYQKKKILS